MRVVVNQVTPDGDTPVFLPAERTGLAEVICANPAGSAPWTISATPAGYALPGAPRDLVVLDRGPFDGPAEEIAETRGARTYVGGARVYAAQEA
jgi:predicted amidohydrolase YtcJ